MADIKCSVPTCKYNKENCCQAESVMVNAIRPGCTSKEGTFCEAYERNDTPESCNTSKGTSCWK